MLGSGFEIGGLTQPLLVYTTISKAIETAQLYFSNRSFPWNTVIVIFSDEATRSHKRNVSSTELTGLHSCTAKGFPWSDRTNRDIWHVKEGIGTYPMRFTYRRRCELRRSSRTAFPYVEPTMQLDQTSWSLLGHLRRINGSNLGYPNVRTES
jgi:hypothetical protein